MNPGDVAILQDEAGSGEYLRSGGWRTGALVLLMAVAYSLMTSCEKKAAAAAKATLDTKAAEATEVKPKRELPKPQWVNSRETAAYNKIVDEGAALMAKRDFAALDDRAHELRESKRFFSDGAWQLQSFYAGIKRRPNAASDSEYLALIGALNEWIKARPESITPRVALVDVYVDYAWKARGNGYANTITAEGGRLMEERLGLARKVLIEGRALSEKCPEWWCAAQGVALGQGWDAGTYNALCEEGLRLYPGYQSIYLYKAYHLQPRWYGETGEWEKYAEDSAKKLGGDEGEMLYARIIWHLHSMGIFTNIFKQSAVKWDRVKRSFDVLLKANPNALGVSSEYAQLACNAGEYETARSLFEKIGGLVDSNVWPRQSEFVTFRTSAYAHP